jgi:hypothetical protein
MRALGKRSVASLLTILLNVGWFISGLLLLLSIALLIVSPWVGTPGIDVDLELPVSIALNPQAHRVSAPSLGIASAELRDVRGSLRFLPLRPAFVAGTAVALMLWMACTLWVIGQLRAVFRTLTAGRPFVAANATRIRRIAWVVIAGEVLRAGLEFSGNRYVMRHFSAEGLQFDARLDVDFFVIVYGLVILVIAEVFRLGSRLDEEQSLTV